MAIQTAELQPGELKVRYVSDVPQEILEGFNCTTSTGTDLRRYLVYDAVAEQRENISTTYVFLPQDDSSAEAFVTLSATGIKAPSEYQQKFPDRYVIPAVMIDFLAVRDERRGQGLGRRVFEWVEARVYPLNRLIGVRFIALEVFASDWRAYQRYASEDWGFRALPLKSDFSHHEESRSAPDPHAPIPAWLRTDRLIPMIYDLVERNGQYPMPATVD